MLLVLEVLRVFESSSLHFFLVAFFTEK